MSKAYIIEVHNRTAGIVAGDERGFTFFSSDRAFDRLDGRDFRSAQQAIADRFAKLGLIPKPVDASDIIWKWSPGS